MFSVKVTNTRGIKHNSLRPLTKAELPASCLLINPTTAMFTSPRFLSNKTALVQDLINQRKPDMTLLYMSMFTPGAFSSKPRLTGNGAGVAAVFHSSSKLKASFYEVTSCEYLTLKILPIMQHLHCTNHYMIRNPSYLRELCTLTSSGWQIVECFCTDSVEGAASGFEAQSKTFLFLGS